MRTLFGPSEQFVCSITSHYSRYNMNKKNPNRRTVGSDVWCGKTRVPVVDTVDTGGELSPRRESVERSSAPPDVVPSPCAFFCLFRFVCHGQTTSSSRLSRGEYGRNAVPSSFARESGRVGRRAGGGGSRRERNTYAFVLPNGLYGVPASASRNRTGGTALNRRRRFFVFPLYEENSPRDGNADPLGVSSRKWWSRRHFNTLPFPVHSCFTSIRTIFFLSISSRPPGVYSTVCTYT